MILEWLYGILLVLCIYTYLIYPLLLPVFAWIIKKPVLIKKEKEMPKVSILMAVRNEEKVLKEKIQSIYQTQYPRSKIELLVGSDASDDRSHEILDEMAVQFPFVYQIFKKRQGKIRIVNALAKKASGEVLIITDANVMFSSATIPGLAAAFSDERIGLADSYMKNINIRRDGISFWEKSYIQWETRIKEYQSRIWGTIMGPFGGCYAIRKDIFTPVPENFLVDDFFQCFEVFKQKKKAIIRKEAIVYEDVSNNPGEEFRRKVRIATGNFQNLRHISGRIWNPFRALSFNFLSHKLLRWFVPHLWILSVIVAFLLMLNIHGYTYAFFLQIFIMLLPLIDKLLRKIKIQVLILRFISHFINMNLAVLLGFLKFLKGVRTNVWEPTKRFQE